MNTNNQNDDVMRVINRHGVMEEISFDEIKNRIKRLINNTSEDKREIIFLDHVCADRITMETISKLYDGITTVELDIESAKVCASLETVHYNYGLLGGRILASNHLKKLKIMNLTTFSDRQLYLNENLSKFFDSSYINFISEHSERLNKISKTDRDYLLSYFAFKTLEKSYLIKLKDNSIEIPQDVFLRVAISIHYRSKDNIEMIFDRITETYNLMSLGYFTHATPTLFNSGTTYEQMSSCYLLGTEDSLMGIFKTITDSALISKWAGGIGIHFSNIRAHDSIISTTNGKSNGIVPWLKIYNEVARAVNQGGKRKGSMAFYLEPWHADIEAFLELKKNTGAETDRTRDIFTALWICDEFMNRVKSDDEWYLMCPCECPGLTDVYDKLDKKDFTELYMSYVNQGKFRKIIKARELFHKIMESQIETGVPYIVFKDNVNRKSNQSNIGIIKSSNLCAEIVEVSNTSEYAVCNLGSIAVNRFVRSDVLDKLNTLELWKSYHKNPSQELKLQLKELLKTIYDFDKLIEVARILTRNLNNIIDLNFYPVPETKLSNLNHRPIGLGVQGMGDLYYILDIPYDSYVAKYIDALIMESIYFGAIYESSDIAKINGSYSSYSKNGGSPFFHGQFQFDLWSAEGKTDYNIYPQMHNWNDLRSKIAIDGMANSLLTSLMPTATTSQLLGNNECFEPYTSNVYKRTTLAGEFQVVNRHLVNKLTKLGIWTDTLRMNIINMDGSMANIKESLFTNTGNSTLTKQQIDYIRSVYKTVWEIKQKDIIDHGLARGPYVDQSQSMNLFYANPDPQKLYSAILYAHETGLKTGCYYLRSKPAIEAIKYGIDTNQISQSTCKSETENECTMCSA